VNPDLTEAVEALTKETRTKVMQGTEVTVITHDPLLRQLEDAVTSAIGNGGGGGQATGSVLNSEALFRASVIRAQIGDWCRQVEVRPTRDMITDLTRWMVAFVADPQWHISTLRGWAREIRDLLDPPKRVPLADPCPACTATKAVGEDGSTSPAVVVEYDQVVLHASLRAVCRVCLVEWVGPDAVDELIGEMKERNPIPELEG